MSQSKPTFQLASAKAPITSLPPGSYLLHATNCVATWGAGIAAELKTVFPEACEEYEAFCHAAKPDLTMRWPPRSLAGKCLIIPPQDNDVAGGAPAVHIVCVFTSYGYGRANGSTGKPGLDSVKTVLKQTDMALRDFRRQLDGRVKEGHDVKEEDFVVYSPMFNSGVFHVPWDRTKASIEQHFEGWQGKWIVMEPPS